MEKKTEILSEKKREKQTTNTKAMSTTVPELEASELERKRRDDSSRQMGQLLLQGWCMLEETCSAGCLVPLMRNKQGREYCVSCACFCDEMVGKESSPEPSTGVTPEIACPGTSNIAEASASGSEASRAQEGSTSVDGDGMLPSPHLGGGFPAPVNFPAPSQAQPFAATCGSQFGSGPQLQPLPNTDIRTTLATLYQVMEEARQRLAVTPVPHCAPLVNLIAECARALEALHSLSSKNFG